MGKAPDIDVAVVLEWGERDMGVWIRGQMQARDVPSSATRLDDRLRALLEVADARAKYLGQPDPLGVRPGHAFLEVISRRR